MNKELPKYLSDLMFDKLWSGNAERDRTTTLYIGVYRGRAAMTVFSGTGGAPKIKLSLPRQHNVLFRMWFAAIRELGPDNKLTIPVQEWDPQNKRMNQIASVTLGLDTANQPYIGISAAGMEAMKFPIRTDLKWDVSTITEINATTLAIDSFLAVMDNSIHAGNLTNFKFDPAQRTGGRGNFAGEHPSGASAPAAGTSVESDEIPF